MFEGTNDLKGFVTFTGAFSHPCVTAETPEQRALL